MCGPNDLICVDRLIDATPDGTTTLMLDAVGGVLGFLLAHVLAGVLAALLPSWRASKADTSATLGPQPLKTAGTRPPFG